MAQLKVILCETIQTLGGAGEIVSVKAGYARNFLLPQKKAILATRGKIAEIEHHQRVVQDRLAREHKDLVALRDKIQSLEFSVEVQAGEEGKLFGSVTSSNIAELLAEKGIEIDRRKIDLDDSIKQVGEYKIPIRLGGEVIAQVKLAVVAAES